MSDSAAVVRRLRTWEGTDASPVGRAPGKHETNIADQRKIKGGRGVQLNAPTTNDNTLKACAVKPMKYDPAKHHRRSVRLAGYDYGAPGAYFVTLVTHGREMFFDQPEARRLAEAAWRGIPAHAPGVVLDEWVVMPNHVHGIIVIGGDGDHRSRNIGDGRGNQGLGDDRRGVQLNAPTAVDGTSNTKDSNDPRRDPNNVFSIMSPRRHTLAVIVRTYKAAVTTACRHAQLDFGCQRGYYEHVARGAADLDRIRDYIQSNPARWAADPLNPINKKP